MPELLLYQKKVVENEKHMSNEELFDEVLSQAQGDDYDGMFTPKGLWEYRYLESKLRERLDIWFNYNMETDMGWTCLKCGTEANVGFRCSWCEEKNPNYKRTIS